MSDPLRDLANAALNPTAGVEKPGFFPELARVHVTFSEAEWQFYLAFRERVIPLLDERDALTARVAELENNRTIAWARHDNAVQRLQRIVEKGKAVMKAESVGECDDKDCTICRAWDAFAREVAS